MTAEERAEKISAPATKPHGFIGKIGSCAIVAINATGAVTDGLMGELTPGQVLEMEFLASKAAWAIIRSELIPLEK